MMQKEYKLTAPDMNRLIGCYSHEIQNPEQPSVALAETLDPLFKAMENLASSKENDEAKGIWVTVSQQPDSWVVSQPMPQPVGKQVEMIIIRLGRDVQTGFI